MAEIALAPILCPACGAELARGRARGIPCDEIALRIPGVAAPVEGGRAIDCDACLAIVRVSEREVSGLATPGELPPAVLVAGSVVARAIARLEDDPGGALRELSAEMPATVLSAPGVFRRARLAFHDHARVWTTATFVALDRPGPGRAVVTGTPRGRIALSPIGPTMRTPGWDAILAAAAEKARLGGIIDPDEAKLPAGLWIVAPGTILPIVDTLPSGFLLGAPREIPRWRESGFEGFVGALDVLEPA